MPQKYCAGYKMASKRKVNSNFSLIKYHKMKKILFSLLLFVFFSSCYTDKWNYRKDAKGAKDARAECFIETSDGKLTKYGKLKYKLPPMSFGYWTGDGSRLNVEWHKVAAYQTGDGYFVRVTRNAVNSNQFEFSDGDVFVVRVRNGKLELFREYATNGRTVSSDKYEAKEFFYIRKGKDAPIAALTKKSLKAAISDNKNIAGDFDDMYKKGHMKDVLNIIDEYN